MSTEGYVKFQYFSKGVPPYYGNKSFPELLDDEKITIETPNLEMSYHQYFGLFKKFLGSVGFDEKSIMQGACNLVFNEMNNEKTMHEVAEEYDLIMSEQLPDIIEDHKKCDNEWIEKTNSHWEERYWAVYHKLVAFENEKRANETMTPWGHSDMEALSQYSVQDLEEDLEGIRDAAKQDKVIKWRLPVERKIEDGIDDYYIQFPDDLLEATNLSPGDEVEWVDQNDGSFLLRKIPKTYAEMVGADSLLTKDRNSNFPIKVNY